MTAPVALLVTGSRSLAKRTDEEARRNITPASEVWARAILAEVIGALPPGSVLIHGGAVGPDSWAHAIICARATEPGVQLWSYCYRPDGMLFRSPIIEGAAYDLRDARWDDSDPGPLTRNAHMVNEAMPRAVERGYEPRVLALVDSTSRTKGTDHTVGLARKAGYPVDRRVWPDPSPRRGILGGMKTTVGWAIKNEKGEYLQCSGAHPVTPFQLRWVKRQWALFPVRPSPAWGGHGRIVKIVRTK